MARSHNGYVGNGTLAYCILHSMPYTAYYSLLACKMVSIMQQ